MKVSAITAYSRPLVVKNSATKVRRTDEPTLTSPPTSIVRISFMGNPAKHPEQIAAYATESNYLGGIYKAGGLGDVAEALPEAIALHGKEIIHKDPDVRTFFPYHSFNNSEGKIYVLKKESQGKGEQLTIQDDFKLVEPNYKLQDGETFALITEAKDNNKVDRYFLMKDASLQGNVERMSMNSFEIESVPYRVFEVDTKGERKDKIYMIHTPETASGQRAYGVYNKYRNTAIIGSSGYGSSGGSVGSSGGVLGGPNSTVYFAGQEAGDMFYTEQVRAMEESLKKMATGKPGEFNPQNIILHDRFGYVMLSDAIQKQKAGDKFYEGMRYVPIFHNIGRGYQGAYANPIDFFRVIATKTDLEKLKADPKFSRIKEISSKITTAQASPEECKEIYNFFKTYFPGYIDSLGTFNLTMIAIDMTKNNPGNCVPGNVSRNFGIETRQEKTKDIALGLTDKLKEIESHTVDVVNGSRAANMATERQDGFFGTGTLNEIFKNTNDPRRYTPYSKKDSPEVRFDAKLANKHNLLNIIADASEKLGEDNDAIAKVFFSNTKMSDIRNGDNNLKLSLGSISKYQEGDILLTSWGRPDSQKGFPITLEAFEEFLKDNTIAPETRKKVKLLMGAGGGNDAFKSDTHPDWKAIQEAINRIENIEVNGQKGFFKGNVCYINGLFPSRIVNCSDLTVLTSRYEPCGITPLESFAAGTPVISTNTGGAPDFIKPGINGFLTDDPFMLSKEALGITDENITPEALDKKRKENIAKQIKTKIQEFIKPTEDGTFKEKQSHYIENCMNEQIEWHNNHRYNQGKSALDKYMHDKLRTQDNDVATEIKSDGRGYFDDSAIKDIASDPKNNTKNWWAKNKKFAIGAACILAAAGIGYAIFKKPKNNKTTIQQENQQLSVVA